MLLTIRDLSAILNASEATIYRWVRERDLPAREVNGHFRAHPVDLLAWLADHPVPVNPRALPTDGMHLGLPSLEAAIRDGGVYRDIPGTTREDVLSALTTRLPPIVGLPADDLRLLLLRAESAGNTFLSEGIAIPNPRYPLIHATVPPMLVVAFPANLVTWNGNGAEVRVLFTLLTPNARSHLRLLGRLMFALRDRNFATLLQRRAEQHELLAAARELDHVTAREASHS